MSVRLMLRAVHEKKVAVELKVAEDVVDRDPFGGADLIENIAEKTKTDCVTLGNRNAVSCGSLALKQNVAPGLAFHRLAPAFRQMADESVTRYVTWCSQATANVSARTSSTRAGLAESP